MSAVHPLSLVLALALGYRTLQAAEPFAPASNYQRNAWQTEFYTKNEKAVVSLAEEYKAFLGTAKTEREVAAYIIDLAKKNRFVSIDKLSAGKLKPGDRVMAVNRNKVVFLAVIGQQLLAQGFRLLEAHGDACRLDLKPHPLYEKEGFALFQTHYYGGIKNYLYLNIPLALHGVVVKKDGQSVAITIGETPQEPVLMIPDLPIHLSYLSREDGADIPAEKLDPLVGSIPRAGSSPADTVDAVKKNILDLLAKKYGISDDDFVSAELQLVPAGPAYDVGLDRSMIGGFGQDDRVCVFTTVRALMEMPVPAMTACVLIDDKEEVGYAGATGRNTPFLAETIARLLELTGAPAAEQQVRKSFSQGMLYYCDATSAVDPLFPEVHELTNAVRLGCGISLNIASEVLDEIARIRGALDRRGIPWQTGQFGKSPGAAGSISPPAMGIRTLYLGLPVLSMHAPLTISSKIDLYAALMAYQAILSEQ
jgi:aspartyl aminopeptidase